MPNPDPRPAADAADRFSRRDLIRTAGLTAAAAAATLPAAASRTAAHPPSPADAAPPRPRTALIVIDPYNDFISEGGKRWNRIKSVATRVGTVPNMLRLVRAARAADGVWVYYSLHHRPKPGDYDGWLNPNPSHRSVRDDQVFAYGTWGGTVRDDFTPQPGDVVCQEHWTTGGFNTTDMDFLLKARGVQNLVICGLLSGSCVEMTGRHGVELGYHVTMVSDAVADADEEVHRTAVEMSYPRFAHAVVNTEQAVAAFERTPS
ncbi:MAG: cysteine hydrolase [Planctomycetota bacterium]